MINNKWGLGIGDWGLGIGDWGLGRRRELCPTEQRRTACGAVFVQDRTADWRALRRSHREGRQAEEH